MKSAVKQCSHFGRCGGCRFQDVPYPDQLRRKEELCRKHLAASEFDLVLKPIVPSPDQSYYRNKMEFAIIGELDVFPAVCPNAWDPVGTGKFLRAAVIGTEMLDVRKIAAESLVLPRSDGIGEAVRPLWELGPSSKDVGGSPEPGGSEGVGSGPDGVLDLEMYFSAREAVDHFELGKVPEATHLELTLQGVLWDGTPFEAYDYVVIVDPPPHLPTPGSLRRSSKTGGRHRPVGRVPGQ